jgi:hypothetical protein
MKKTFFNIIALFACVLSFDSCESYLDIDEYIYDKMTIDSVFTSKQRVLEYINGTAAYLLDESKLVTGASYPSGLATDDAFTPWVDWNHHAMYLMIDQITPRSTYGFNPWGNFYKGIRKANILLARINECKELTDLERRDYTGRAYFLRGYFYYSLMRMYGPVPLLPETAFDTDETADNASYERSSYNDCIEFVCSDFEKAAAYLLVDREEVDQYIPTKGAALAVMARLQLYAASPLFNGNTYYSEWKRSDGTPFISQQEDKARWGKAATAFKQVIDLGKYELNTVPKIVSSKGVGTLPLPTTVSNADFPDGAGNIDPYKSYKTIFDGSILPIHNKELIYYSVRNDGDDWTFYPNPLGGINGFSVTQDMVDSYRMADGRQYSEASATEKSWEAVGSGLTFSDNYVLSADRARMHDNREPRFYASIGFNYCVWPGTSFKGTEPVKYFAANYFKDGNSQPSGVYSVDYNRTGYTSRKYINQEDISLWQGSKKAKTYPMFRYAEVLLGYVEAMNEMDGSYTDEKSGITVSKNTTEMVKYFNMVRYRAGLPGITEAEASNYQTMKDLIKQELRVEFAFEDHRYYDLRRWKDAYNAYNMPITGMDVSANVSEREKFYTIRVWNTEVSMKRTFSNKMYFFPIDQYVLDRNAKLVQNPGW